MLKKWLRNLGSQAIQVLGLPVVMKMWRASLVKLPAILKARNLFPIDRFMADGTVYTIRHRLGQFRVDPLAIDQLVPENSCCFSAVRELYIKDCYLRYHDCQPEEIKTVVDLGANRGMASLMFTPVAELIIAVEALPQYRKAIAYNLETLNGFANYQIVSQFIGNENKQLPDGMEMITFSQLMENATITNIDFLKIDIEGSEFDIFPQLPFGLIHYMSMEVHHAFGEIRQLIEVLKQNHFSIRLATRDMKLTHQPELAEYIFARNAVYNGGNQANV
jgi:hypothetical protein